MSESISELSTKVINSLNSLDATCECAFEINDSISFLQSMIFEGSWEGYLTQKRDSAIGHLVKAKGCKRWDSISEYVNYALNDVHAIQMNHNNDM